MGYVLKSKEGGKPGKDDLALINRYTRRPFSEEEIYTFSVVLCDNEVDRDFERFYRGCFVPAEGSLSWENRNF